MTYASTTTLNLIRDANPCEAELAPSLAAALLVAERALRKFRDHAVLADTEALIRAVSHARAALSEIEKLRGGGE